jgi:acetolactate synthase-1/2/3 large subunit
VLSLRGLQDGGDETRAAESGDTANRRNRRGVGDQLVWIDGAYDMVRFQEVAEYGRASGVDFGPVDVVRFAEAFGASGLKIERPDQIAPILKTALEMQGPVLVGVPVDYRDNHRLMEIVHPGVPN